MKNDPIELLPPMEYFNSIGNNESKWELTSYYLLKSTNIIYKNIGKPPKYDKNKKYSNLKNICDWMYLHSIARMLRGMALECMLKAVWLHYGGILVKNGKYIGIPQAKNHDLFSIYNRIHTQCNLNFDKEELLMLCRFSYAITDGRYPIQRSFLSYPSAPLSFGKVYWNKVEYVKDNKIFKAIIKKIKTHLKTKCALTSRSS